MVFRVDYTVEQLGNREFGTVFLGTTNVAEVMVAAGMAKVSCTQTARLVSVTVVWSRWLEAWQRCRPHAHQ